jgi:hypothetical protein
MSSRSFRRRNNRRRHRSAAGGEGTGQRPEGQQKAGGQTEQGKTPQRPGPADRAEAPRRAGGPGQGGRSGPARPAEQRPQRREPPLVFPDCPLCGKPVRELSSALTHRVSRQPAHFDCIVRELRDSTEIGPEEKLCYLGGGSFGVLEFRPAGAASRFVIKKRIQYEEKETPQDWKKPLQVSC